MKLSIITATYNSSQTVADTLASVQRQSYPNIEHIVVDGASRDNTLDIVRRFPHVATLVSEKDNGIYDAMNKGIGLTNGDVIGILNSDDIYSNEQTINKVMAAFEDPSIDAVYGDLQYVSRNDLEKVTRTWRAGNYARKKFYFGWMPPHPTFFVRKSVYEEIGAFKCALRSSADYEFILRALLKYNYKAYYIPEVLVKMRNGGMSNASLKHRLRANREDREAWKLNGLRPYFFTVPFKPIRKIFQFIIK